jgi:tetratricopeptide (TPR) repeat protein
VGRPATFLVADERPGALRTNPEFARLFLPGEFDLRPLNFRMEARKPPNTARIVILGESAAQGVPVPSFAFGPQLRAQLRARFPGRAIEVLNTGIVAINSHVIYQIAREMARYEPDLFVVYAGNNEVVGPYGPGCAYLSQAPPLWMIRASVFVRSTRTGQLAGALVARLRGRAAAAEWGGMSMFVNNAVAGDDPRLATVYANFEANLDGIVDAASRAGAKTVLCTAVSNLKDCPPFLSRHGPGMSAADLAAWTAAFEAGRLAWRLGDPSARPRLEEALRLDPQYADTHFMLGLLDLEAGDTASARRHLVGALHWDALRFRPDPEINNVIRRVAGRHRADAVLVDSAVALGSDPESTAPPSGRELLLEHVHFDWPGNCRMALLMARACAAALGDGGASTAAFLGPEACADALGYTRHERLPMLMGINVLVRKPPFTNQLTYVGDQARLAREINAAGSDFRAPAVTEGAERVVRRALAADPDNPALAGILEGLCNEEGNRAEALEFARRAQRLVPRDYSLGADEASILVGLGRYAEAEATLGRAAETGADLDLLAPVYGELWARSGRFSDGLGFLAEAIARRPDDRRLRLARGELLRRSGNRAGAERELRGILAGHPSDEDALEALVGVLADEGRPEAAAQAGLAAADLQPLNQANNLRAAKACEDTGDGARAVRYLEAAERSGPVNTTFELELALKQYKQARYGDMMTRLAEALALSRSEGNPALTGSIQGLIGRMSLQAHGADPGAR